MHKRFIAMPLYDIAKHFTVYWHPDTGRASDLNNILAINAVGRRDTYKDVILVIKESGKNPASDMGLAHG